MLLTARRAVIGAIGAGAVAGAMLLAAAPSALADRPPNCTAADLASVASGVSAATSAYLFTHPDVNDFFTGLEGAPRDTRPGRSEDVHGCQSAGEGGADRYSPAAGRHQEPLR